MKSGSPQQRIPSGVLAPRGFRGAAVSCGLKSKPGALDLALLVSDGPAAAAGMFTRNRVAAAPVQLSRRRLRRPWLRAIVINAGNANACTGPDGLADAEAVATEAASVLGVKPHEVAVASTGKIGERLPLSRVVAGIHAAGKKLATGPLTAGLLARAIMTTDTVPKSAAVSFTVAGREYRVGGMAKGAGMIAPHLATMLAFLTTDATVSPRALRTILRDVVEATFNRITVEGDTSTNDSVFLLANGAAGGPLIEPGGAGFDHLREAVMTVADTLAEKLILDAEGATKFVEVRVTGAVSPQDAERAARAVAESVLLKCALFGNDPNWGRIACAVGYSGARFQQENLAIDLAGVPVVRCGTPVRVEKNRLLRAVRSRRLNILVNLAAGSYEARFRTCDLSHKYVEINALYHT